MAAIRQQTLCLDAVSKAHLRRDQLRGWRVRWIKVVGAPVTRAQIGARISRGSRERRMRRLRNGQLYSVGLTRVRIEALLASARATLIGRFKGRVIRDGSHRPPVRLRPCVPLGFQVPYGSPEFGCSFASKCDKGSAGSVPVGGRLTAHTTSRAKQVEGSLRTRN